MSDPFGLNKTLDPAVMGNPKTQGATSIAESVLPLEPVPQNHFGPTDASKGHSSHGEHDGSWGEHGYHKTRYPNLALCFGERQDKTKQKEGKTRKSRTVDQDKRSQYEINTTQDRSRDLRINIHAHQ